MLATLLGSGTVVLLAALAEAELFFDLGVVGAFLFWGLLVTGLTAGLAKMLLHLQKAMSAEESEKPARIVHLPSFFGRACPGVSWQMLRDNLQAHGEELRDDPARRKRAVLALVYQAVAGLGRLAGGCSFYVLYGFVAVSNPEYKFTRRIDYFHCFCACAALGPGHAGWRQAVFTAFWLYAGNRGHVWNSHSAVSRPRQCDDCMLCACCAACRHQRFHAQRRVHIFVVHWHCGLRGPRHFKFDLYKREAGFCGLREA